MELLSGKEYKREDVRGNGRNPNGIGSGNRSGGTTWRRIGVSLAGTWSAAWHVGWCLDTRAEVVDFLARSSCLLTPNQLQPFPHFFLRFDAPRIHRLSTGWFTCSSFTSVCCSCLGKNKIDQWTIRSRDEMLLNNSLRKVRWKIWSEIRWYFIYC